MGGRGNVFGREGLAFGKGGGADGGDGVRGGSVGAREEQVGDEPGGDHAGCYYAPIEVREVRSGVCHGGVMLSVVMEEVLALQLILKER